MSPVIAQQLSSTFLYQNAWWKKAKGNWLMIIIIMLITLTTTCVWCCRHDQSHCESSPGSSDECRLSAGWLLTLRPSQSTWAASLLKNWQLPSTSTIAIVIITQPVSRYSFYRPTEGGRLSWPRHCSRGAQPVPKAVYRSGCRDKHNRLQCDSNLDPLTAVRRANH